MKIQEPTSRFVKLRCNRCKNEQVSFGKPSMRVKCLVCNTNLIEPTGGKGKIKSRILEVLD